MSHQLTHQENTFKNKQFPITVICDHLDSPANQGALFRVCEAFGVKEIIFYGNTIDIKSSRLKRTARSTEKLIPYSCVTNLEDVLATIQKPNTQLIGIEITSNSKPIQQLSLSNDKNIVIILGSEKHGISTELLSQINSIYHIPMFGTNSSMNVIQSAGIALYAVTNKVTS